MTLQARRLRADGEATRIRLVEAAGRLFAAGGFAETTSTSIAARAGVPLASINYHFGNRGGLYQAVLVEAHRRLIDLADLQRLAQSEGPAAEKLASLIGRLVTQATRRRPGWHVNVLVRELLAPSSHVQVLFRSELPPKLAIVGRILSDITRIPPDDPALGRCAISVFAPCAMLLIGARGLPGPLQAVRRMPPEVISGHLVRFALAGLEAIGEGQGRITRP